VGRSSLSPLGSPLSCAHTDARCGLVWCPLLCACRVAAASLGPCLTRQAAAAALGIYKSLENILLSIVHVVVRWLALPLRVRARGAADACAVPTRLRGVTDMVPVAAAARPPSPIPTACSPPPPPRVPHHGCDDALVRDATPQQAGGLKDLTGGYALPLAFFASLAVAAAVVADRLAKLRVPALGAPDDAFLAPAAVSGESK